MNEPLSQVEAKKLIRTILSDGSVNMKHAREEMAKDGLVEIDVVNVFRGGVVEPGEWENGSWRYRVRTQRIFVVVVTAWRCP